MRRGLLRAHRAVGPIMAAFWLLQVVTGSLLVFRWELEDALLAGPRAAADGWIVDDHCASAWLAAITGLGLLLWRGRRRLRG